jgi:hypothetical protein
MPAEITETGRISCEESTEKYYLERKFKGPNFIFSHDFLSFMSNIAAKVWQNYQIAVLS